MSAGELETRRKGLSEGEKELIRRYMLRTAIPSSILDTDVRWRISHQ